MLAMELRFAFHHAGEKIIPENLRNMIADNKEVEDIKHIASTFLETEPRFNYSGRLHVHEHA